MMQAIRRPSSASGPSTPSAESKQPLASPSHDALVETLQSLLAAAPAAQAAGPQKKCIFIKCGVEPLRRVVWYDPTPADALDRMLRVACNIDSAEEYMLCDTDCSPVALASSLPSELTLELVRQPRRPLAPPCDNPRPADTADAIVVVDPVSTGAVLSYQIFTKRRLHVVCVWSDVVPEELKSFVAKGMAVDFVGRVQHVTGKLADTVTAVRSLGVNVREVIVGCETGVLLGDELSEALQLRSNGIAKSSLRRNKFLQQEAVRAGKLNACGQQLAETADDVEAFLREYNPTPFKAVVKPVEGAGSDGVSICSSADEVRAAFKTLEGTKNVLGLTNYSVLLQEYLQGIEYVVDTVSRNGVHKCVAIWRYDKREFNGAPFVYFGMQLLPADAEPHLREMVDYTFGVLDVLGIEHGCCHTEIKQETRGPVLIEVNCRVHGGEGTWAPMAEACLGYSAVSALLDAYLDPAAFAALPRLPLAFKAHAMEAKLRSAVEGTLTRIDEEGMAAIRALKSYRAEFVPLAVGKPVFKTIDAVSASGNINLVNEDLQQLHDDYEKLHEIVGKGLFYVNGTAPSA